MAPPSYSAATGTPYGAPAGGAHIPSGPQVNTVTTGPPPGTPGGVGNNHSVPHTSNQGPYPTEAPPAYSDIVK